MREQKIFIFGSHFGKTTYLNQRNGYMIMSDDNEILQRRRLISRLLCLPHLRIIKIGIELGLAEKEDINVPEELFLKHFYNKLKDTNSFLKLWDIMELHNPDHINTINPFK